MEGVDDMEFHDLGFKNKAKEKKEKKAKRKILKLISSVLQDEKAKKSATKG